MIASGSTACDRFRHMAAKGAFRGASTYERVAFLVAEAIGKATYGMDAEALKGLAIFARDAADHPNVIYEWVDAISRAGDFRK